MPIWLTLTTVFFAVVLLHLEDCDSQASTESKFGNFLDPCPRGACSTAHTLLSSFVRPLMQPVTLLWILWFLTLISGLSRHAWIVLIAALIISCVLKFYHSVSFANTTVLLLCYFLKFISATKLIFAPDV